MAKKPVKKKTDNATDAELVSEADVADEKTVADNKSEMDPPPDSDDTIADITDETDIVQDSPPVFDDDIEEHHVSFAARSLQILALIGLGSLVGIWAAPRIAPLLPAGLAPVAQWLSPANNAAIEDLENLRASIESRLIRLETLPSRAEIETRLANFQTDSVNPVRAQMTALSDQVAAADSTAVESRLWALEGRVEGLIAEIGGLTASLGDIAAEGGAISADTAASISAYRTRIDGLQASLDEMAAAQGAMSQKIDEVAVTAQRQVREAETLVAEANQESARTLQDAELQTNLAAIETALKSGAPFSAPLERIAVSAKHPVPAALAAAQNGVPTLEELQTTFVPAAHGAIRAAIAPEKAGGLFAGFGSFLRSQVATRSLTPQSGDSADAVLSRMEAALQRADLAAVLIESQSLPGQAHAEMAPWLAQLTTRQTAKLAFADLRAALIPEEQE